MQLRFLVLSEKSLDKFSGRAVKDKKFKGGVANIGGFGGVAVQVLWQPLQPRRVCKRGKWLGRHGNDLVNPGYRHSLFYINPGCISLVPKTPDNAPFCDSAVRGFSAALAAATCANIRGNIGRNTIIGPGLFNVDFSVFKNNRMPKLSETSNLQFRAEFFNVLNHTNFAPTSNLSPFNANGTPNTLFGQLTSTQVDNRVIQFALKLIW